jgi:hypothetical protein
VTTPAPPLTLQQQLTPQTLATVRAQYLALLQSQGFPAITEWAGEPTGLEMNYVNMVCQAIANLAGTGAPADQQIASTAAAKFLRWAAGGWLDVLAEQVYLTTRGPATSTTFSMSLDSVASAPNYGFEVGDVWLVGPSGKRYQNTSAGDLSPGGTVELAFRAENPGSTYDDDPRRVVLELATAYAGVTVRAGGGDFGPVTNGGGSTGRVDPVRTSSGVAPTPHHYSVRVETSGEPNGATYSVQVDDGPFTFSGVLRDLNVIGGGTSVKAVAGAAPSFIAGDVFVFSTPGGPNYVQGDDPESDAFLSRRCQLRWPSLSLNVLAAKAELWVLTAYPSVNRIDVEADEVNAGRFVVTVADSHGAVDQVAIDAIESFVKPKLGVGEDMTVRSAVNASILTSGNVRVPRSTSGIGLQAIQERAQDDWVAYLASVEIGGIVRLAKLVEIVMDAGAIDVGDVTPARLNAAAENVQVAAGAVPVSGDFAGLAVSLVWMRA